MVAVSSTAFCGGFLCRKTDRKAKCFKCKEYICSNCTKMYKEKKYCPDCYLELDIKEQWQELKLEFVEMLGGHKDEKQKNTKKVCS